MLYISISILFLCLFAWLFLAAREKVDGAVKPSITHPPVSQCEGLTHCLTSPSLAPSFSPVGILVKMTSAYSLA